jgi:hypothetical protein
MGPVDVDIGQARSMKVRSELALTRVVICESLICRSGDWEVLQAPTNTAVEANSTRAKTIVPSFCSPLLFVIVFS